MGSLKHRLFVEDDPKDVALPLTALGEHNLAHGVAFARDGVEALDYLHRRGEFASRPEGNPIVILTSSCEYSNLDKCYRLGVNAYVVRPVRFVEFSEAVKGIGVFWGLVNEPPPNILSGR